MPANPEVLKALCYDDAGAVKPRQECRTVLINHLITTETMDVDEAEELANETLTALKLWPTDEQRYVPDVPPSPHP